jgi:membrane-associated phospholipid phosphatase
MDSSVEFQVSLQSAAESSFLKAINNLFSLILTPELVIAALIVSFVIVSDQHKLPILNFLIFFAAAVYLATLMKSVLAEPRPYMVKGEVQRWDWVCYMEFGMPSGHCFLGVVLLEFVVRQFVLRGEQAVSLNNPSKRRYIYRKSQIIFAVLLGFLVLCIAFSRLYLGMHTYAQVLLGLVCGIYFSMLYRFAI